MFHSSLSFYDPCIPIKLSAQDILYSNHNVSLNVSGLGLFFTPWTFYVYNTCWDLGSYHELIKVLVNNLLALIYAEFPVHQGDYVNYATSGKSLVLNFIN